MSKYSRLGKNTALVFVGNIGSKMISLLMLPFYTTWLSVADYGATDLISVYVTFLLSIVTCCLSEAIFIFPKDQEVEKQKEYFSSGLIFSAICFIIVGFLFALTKQIFQTYQISNTFTDYTWFIWGMIVSTFLQAYIQQFSRSIDKVRVYALSGIVLTALTALFSFVLIPKFGLFGYLYAQILSLLLSGLYTFLAIKGFQYFSIYIKSISSCHEMLKYSMPLIPNGIMWWLVGALNRPIMEDKLGLDAVGLFAVANKFPSIIIMLFTVFIFSWQISVIEEFKKEGYKEFYNKILRMLFMGLTFLSCLIAIFSKLIISVMANEKFYDAWKYVPILCIAVLFSSLSGFVGTNFSATRESKYYFYSSIWGALASILFNFILIPRYGLWGVSLAVVLSYMVMAISRIIYSWKYVQIDNAFSYLAMLIINVCVISVTYYIDSILLRFIAFSALFLTFLLINKSLYPDLKNLFRTLFNKIK
ncbi:lipopolysaccharide biosynthesis protein [Dysgonomonas capnocytophagoides]|uniref:lipopolysaccharide biosynthesis protein n=1 Tax=Dysgonomonas capnocytophagoides TaxID=45254 RepID=UPI002923CF9B|nr:oligosaccharide flippase family protein [Dysgonomonas capnocytophagoides]